MTKSNSGLRAADVNRSITELFGNEFYGCQIIHIFTNELQTCVQLDVPVPYHRVKLCLEDPLLTLVHFANDLNSLCNSNYSIFHGAMHFGHTFFSFRLYPNPSQLIDCGTVEPNIVEIPKAVSVVGTTPEKDFQDAPVKSQHFLFISSWEPMFAILYRLMKKEKLIVVIHLRDEWFGSLKALDDKPMCIFSVHYPNQAISVSHHLNHIDNSPSSPFFSAQSILPALTEGAFQLLLHKLQTALQNSDWDKIEAIFCKIKETLEVHGQSKLKEVVAQVFSHYQMQSGIEEDIKNRIRLFIERLGIKKPSKISISDILN